MLYSLHGWVIFLIKAINQMIWNFGTDTIHWDLTNVQMKSMIHIGPVKYPHQQKFRIRRIKLVPILGDLSTNDHAFILG